MFVVHITYTTPGPLEAIIGYMVFEFGPQDYAIAFIEPFQ